ncbi:MAG: DUF1653 domain-containing protein [Lachnospiraceae bacterium]|nr:DUF1653 domain-containing protein [Lachnospiraceae bacterium]
MNTIKPFQIYRHFKGNYYQVVCIAENSESGKQEVIYRALYGDNKIYARDLEMFTSDVDKEKYPDAVQVKRFEPVEYEDAVKKERQTARLIEGPEKEKPEKERSEKAEAAKAEPVKKEESPYENKNSAINPVLLKFLDAVGYEQQLECLTEIREDLTEEILIPIELSLGMEEQKGSIDQRYRGIKNYISLKQRYEKTGRL